MSRGGVAKNPKAGRAQLDLAAMQWARLLPRANEAQRKSFANWILLSPGHLEAFVKYKTIQAELQAMAPGRRVDELLARSKNEPVFSRTSLNFVSSAGARSTMTRATDIEQQASEWIIRSERGHFTEGKRIELARWLEVPRHELVFLRLREAWRRANRVRSAHQSDWGVDADLLAGMDRTVTRDSNSKLSWRLRVAAGAALAVCMMVLGVRSLTEPRWISYETGIGGYKNITLADGSVVQLNTDSEIRAHLTAHRRELQLIRGEALVQVAADAQRPLTVNAANTAVRTNALDDLRTAFVVRLRTAQSVDVAVTEGRVLLEPSDRFLDLALGRSAKPQSTLGAGETATVRPEGVHLARVALEDLNRKLTWTAGLLSFQGETLAEVADEFNRYNSKQLIVTDPLIASRRIGGVFRATEPDSFVSALRQSFGVQAYEQAPTFSETAIVRLGAARANRAAPMPHDSSPAAPTHR